MEWFAGYAKEAKVSTAGIRGPQNILYPQDTRFPNNLVGIFLATLAKAIVAREKYEGKEVPYDLFTPEETVLSHTMATAALKSFYNKTVEFID